MAPCLHVAGQCLLAQEAAPRQDGRDATPSQPQLCLPVGPVHTRRVKGSDLHMTDL